MGWATLLMLWVTCIWSANTVAGKFGLRGFGPLALAQLRVFGAAAGFFLVYVILRGWPTLHLSRREWIFIGLAGLNGVTLNQLSYIGGLALTSVAHTALIVALGPVVVLGLACALRMEILTRRKILGMLIAFLGVAVLAVGQPAEGSGASGIGDFIVLVGRIAFAYYTILLKQNADHYDSLTLNMLTFALGALLMLPFSLHSLVTARWTHVPADAWEGLAFLVIFGSVLAYLMYTFALKIMAASQAAAFVYLEPAIAILLGVWLLSERISGSVWVAGAMILLGLFLTGLGKAETPLTGLD